MTTSSESRRLPFSSACRSSSLCARHAGRRRPFRHSIVRCFVSDNAAPVHPKILQAIIDANKGDAVAYGDDPWTQRAIERFRQHFGAQTDVYLTYNGTGANVIGLASVLRPYEAVICADSAHLQTDECGALERFAGSKVLPAPARDGKLTIEAIAPIVRNLTEEHHVKPRAISISQSTEFGTVYKLEELKAISGFATQHDLIIHMDGARLANAAVALGCSLRDLTLDAGVDVLTFGGTKNGLLCGEATLFFNPRLHEDSARYVRKQATQLASKMRFIAAQFEALLSEDLWSRNAAHANAMAKLLEQEVAAIPSIRITRPVESNAVFATLPREAIPRLQRHSYFYVFDQAMPEVRWMTSFDTTEKDVAAFARLLASEQHAA
ncbi:MAG: low specificity L-threonine aldolase [Candidatus Eremiobacteraeota bacterium]|nr:low specificity L-threonine aldolase [Candidatus Eremiobacteraeota bacterium]